ncbi:hypothetical protein [Nakamurella lactea]|uniref:hypothetical protein n=1 Tax=Nakamurella lactea TaxID=459515 RepID=UPI000429011F|nr:hypothetical protein [Nakamurella lactea]
MSDPRPKIILQAHATRSKVALAVLLHSKDRGARDLKKPFGALIAGAVLAVVILVGFYVAGRLGAMSH